MSGKFERLKDVYSKNINMPTPNQGAVNNDWRIQTEEAKKSAG